MKKIILNEWTFIFSVLSFVFVSYLTTGFSNNDFASIIINFFSTLLLVSLVISVLVTDISKKLKWVVYGFVMVMFMISMSSCSTSGYGCRGKSKYITGYRSPMGFGY